MDLSKYFILLNGEPKTLQINTIQKMVSMAIVCVLKITNAPTTMAVIKLFGSTIQNGKTLLNVRSLWIANCRMTSAKYGDLIIMDNPVGESSTTMVLHRMIQQVEFLLRNLVFKK